MADVLDDLSVKQLPEVQGYNGSYVDEDVVLQTYQEAADEIRKLRALNEKAARCLSVAYAALGTLAMSEYAGSRIASNAMRRMAEITDSDQ